MVLTRLQAPARLGRDQLEIGDMGGRPRWYLILTKPASEEKAKQNLERQAYRIYFPRVEQRKLHRNRWLRRIAALFPRYIFLRLNPRQSLAPVRSTPGVVDVVRFGTEFATVPESVINGLVGRADPDTGLHRLHAPPFTAGADVRLTEGAFAGLDGVFKCEAGGDRVIVLLTLLGREAAVTVPVKFVVLHCA